MADDSRYELGILRLPTLGYYVPDLLVCVTNERRAFCICSVGLIAVAVAVAAARASPD